MATARPPADSRKQRGQFFTPPEVARFLVELLVRLSPGLRTAADTRIIDPACGEGVFLDAARAVLPLAPSRLVGVDLYPQAGGFWDDGGGVIVQRVADGLLEPDEGDFDLVLGNPPFHSDALHCLRDPDGDVERIGRARRLESALLTRYSLWREIIQFEPPRRPPQLALPGTAGSEPDPRLPARTRDQLSRYPAELMFLERFVQLCRPGGHVAIVLPEGVVANRRLQYVRDWLLGRCQVLGVVSLPRGTFRRSGTAAVTATLLLRRRREGEEGEGGRSMLLRIERLDRLEGLLEQVEERVAAEGEGKTDGQ
jgi:hypothetical protein